MTVAGLAAVGLATGLVAMPSASAEELPSCRIWADAPWEDNGVITGVGHRDGCVQRRQTITVRIRKDIPWTWDRTIAEQTWTDMVNGTFSLHENCPRGEAGKFFAEILTNAGGKAQSTRRELQCPS